MGMIVALLVLFTISVGSCDDSCIIAQFDKNITERQLDCTFSVSGVPAASSCNTILRQVFRLLDVNDEYVLIGSTECLYALTPDLEYDSSISIPQPSDSLCSNLNLGEKTDFICKNYISTWFNTNTIDPTTFQVCGTYDAMRPRCWNCNKNNTGLTCVEDEKTVDNLPTDPIENVTSIMTEDGSNYFIGGREDIQSGSSNMQCQISRVNVGSGEEEIKTPDEEQVMYPPHDFVGEPIEYGKFIYFFFREKAFENYLQPMIYSRIARVCKTDPGGETNPLRMRFTTYLKARLMCSCGDDFPMIYNEIQDVDAVSQDDGNMVIYGLFTTPNSMASSSSVICRYSLMEIEALFNNDNRRGPSQNNIDMDSTLAWTMRPKFVGDSAYKRETCEPYEYDSGLYKHLLNFPLLNTNVPNCGLGRMDECTDGTRANSHDALAVFQSIRGQQLTISDSSEDRIQVYIGTNNRAVFEVDITTTQALIAKHITLKPEDMPSNDILHKWPYGISSLRTHKGTIYGNMDSCAFRFPPYPCRDISGLVFERIDTVLASHTQKIPKAVTNFFTLFDAPIGTDMVPHFSGLFSDSICSGKRFDAPANNKEILHVFCQITSEHIASTEADDICPDHDVTANPTLTGYITIVSGETCEIPDNYQPVFEERIDIDCTDIYAGPQEHMLDVKEFDRQLAEYRYNFTQWMLHQTDSDTCPAAAEPRYP